ncbi:O-antigen ligase family protein [Lentibacillus sp. Marseille-P4043]|uniref:O-antigen ligase family protein n=1 Tax=Lentibacillus sp. Marseille-P4043 TaxID=2040293 RepID=UPI00131A4B32|nr:O-antigen ligase family protein [Lentibacillus sp. Marseille-P4043]
MEFGLTYIFYVFVGLLAIIVGLGLKNIRYEYIDIILKGIAIITIPISIINIIFFLYPESEIIFLKSEIAGWLMHPGTVNGLFEGSPNNILDPTKAGTVFVNTNVAAVFFNILYWIGLSIYLANKNKIYLFISLLHLSAMLTTNSRAGILSLVLSSVIVFLIFSKRNLKTLSCFIFGIPIFVIGIIWVLMLGDFSNILDRLSVNTIENDPRMSLWSSIPIIVDNYILGLGFGGWEQFHNMPAHNIFLIIWLQSGLLGLFAILLLFIYILKESYRGIRKQYINIIVFASTIIVLIQGSFDNYFLNNLRISLLYFLLVGLIFSSRGPSNKQKSSSQ